MLSLGSNLGDRAATLATAVTALTPWLRVCSPVYETRPWGPVAQGDYLNIVVLVGDPGASAPDWWQRAQALERAADRQRSVRFGPRTLDVDVIAVDGVQSTDPVLTLPHPRAAERAFVLIPWLAVDPDAVLPGAGRVADLVAALDPDDVRGVRPVGPAPWTPGPPGPAEAGEAAEAAEAGRP